VISRGIHSRSSSASRVPGPAAASLPSAINVLPPIAPFCLLRRSRSSAPAAGTICEGDRDCNQKGDQQGVDAAARRIVRERDLRPGLLSGSPGTVTVRSGSRPYRFGRTAGVAAGIRGRGCRLLHLRRAVLGDGPPRRTAGLAAAWVVRASGGDLGEDGEEQQECAERRPDSPCSTPSMLAPRSHAGQS